MYVPEKCKSSKSIHQPAKGAKAKVKTAAKLMQSCDGTDVQMKDECRGLEPVMKFEGEFDVVMNSHHLFWGD